MRTANGPNTSSRLLRLGALAGALAVIAFTVAHVSAFGTTMDTEAARLDVTTFAKGLEHPWGMTFLPDGRMLVTERPGRLRLVATDGTLSEPLQGVPEVYASGQGGLLDVALDPDFKTTSGFTSPMRSPARAAPGLPSRAACLVIAVSTRSK